MSTRGDAKQMMQSRRQGQPVANPDDPPVHRPPQGPGGPLPEPNYLGLPGRTAIVQGQVFLYEELKALRMLVDPSRIYLGRKSKREAAAQAK